MTRLGTALGLAFAAFSALAFSCEGTYRWFPSCPPDSPPGTLPARDAAGEWDCATLQDDCSWLFPDGGVWTGGPQETPDGLWVWPDGRERSTQDLDCRGKATTDASACGGCDAPRVCNAETETCVECVADADCPKDKVCDKERNACIECFVQNDCDDGELCNTNDSDSRRNECVECLANADCTAPNQVCNLDSNKCTFQCDGSPTDPCTGDQPECNLEDGVCVACTENAHCTGNPNGTECNTVTNQCVQCVTQAPCELLGQVCDVSGNTCVECFINDDCADPARPQCDAEKQTCFACLNDDQCTAADASRCNLATHTCVACTNDNQCEGNDFCQEGVCVACRDNGDCTPPTLCEPVSGTCVACIGNSDCPSPDAARCDQLTHACVSCIGNEDCTTQSGRGLCEAGRCVACASNTDCDDDAASSRCDLVAGTCGPCQVDNDCNEFEGQRSCIPGSRCVECDANTDCAGNGNGETVCKLTGNGSAPLNTCVECVESGDCTNPAASRCENNECVPCTQDEHCSGILGPPNNTAFVCDTSGGAGVCVQCTSTNFARCALNGSPRVCDSQGPSPTCSATVAPNSAGACQGCIADAQCGDNQLCVEQTFDGTSVGFFCFTRSADETCPVSGRPLVSPKLDVVSIDGVASDVCGLALTTCEGLADFGGGQSCTEDADCGAPPVGDGVCSGGGCTVPCGGNGANCLGTCTITAPSVCQ